MGAPVRATAAATGLPLGGPVRPPGLLGRPLRRENVLIGLDGRVAVHGRPRLDGHVARPLWGADPQVDGAKAHSWARGTIRATSPGDRDRGTPHEARAREPGGARTCAPPKIKKRAQAPEGRPRRGEGVGVKRVEMSNLEKGLLWVT